MKSRMITAFSVGIFIIAGLFITVPTVGAAPVTPFVPAIPQLYGPLPVTAQSVPWGTAEIPGVRNSIDLASYGYVEEEFFVSGHANVYQYDAQLRVEVRTPDVPYTSRILVRRPLNKHKFSGNVQVEFNHPQYGFSSILSFAGTRLLRNGDASVSITTRRSNGPAIAISAIEVLTQLFNPQRYAAINFPEDGLNWDLILQVGRLLKSDAPQNPLAGYGVERLYACGYSGGGALVQFIHNEFQALAHLPSGATIFDAYLVGEPSGYPSIYRGAASLPPSDPRPKIVIPTGIPKIELHTRSTPLAPSDSDDPNNRYCKFEVAGLNHTPNPITDGTVGYHLCKTGYPYPLSCDRSTCTMPNYDIQLGDYVALTWYYLDVWSRDGIAPPHAPVLIAGTDEYGNPLGGIRSPYLEVPIATYYAATNPGCPGYGARVPFSEELLKDLYPNHGTYVSEFIQRTHDLLHEGWLLPEDAQRIRVEAPHSDVSKR
jgi:hypothetical protein